MRSAKGAKHPARPALPPGKGRAKRRIGRYGMTVPAAGELIGMTRSAAYRAAKSGLIPTLEGGRIVPRLIWERQLGIENERETAHETALEKEPAE